MGAPPIVIVNETLAALLSPEASPIGGRLLIAGVPHEVVGIVADMHPRSLVEPPVPYFYRPYWQGEDLVDARLTVRVAGDAAAMTEAVLEQIRATDPLVPVSEVGSLRAKIEERSRSLRLAEAATRAAGGLTVLLCAVGLYGLLALAVGQRRREIGIRMALGARRGDVVWLVVGGGARCVLAGVAVGVPTAWR